MSKPKLFDDTQIWVTESANRMKFWSYVTKGPSCWNYDHGARGRWGHRYFAVRVNGETRGVHAHRFAWYLTHGRIPAGLMVCHNCPDGDNPGCVNPAHLFLGTPADNVRDCERKGRGVHPRGEEHGRSKLTEFEVAEILSLRFRLGLTLGRLSRDYGVSKSALNHIFNGRNWYHMAREFGVREQKQKQYARSQLMGDNVRAT